MTLAPPRTARGARAGGGGLRRVEEKGARSSRGGVSWAEEERQRRSGELVEGLNALDRRAIMAHLDHASVLSSPSVTPRGAASLCEDARMLRSRALAPHMPAGVQGRAEPRLRAATATWSTTQKKSVARWSVPAKPAKQKNEQPTPRNGLPTYLSDSDSENGWEAGLEARRQSRTSTGACLPTLPSQEGTPSKV